ncbi:MAG TPA: CBS domain-containing protein [Polyangia bacterium]|jgi:acetoin utilization protein AcuB|nr:CBS domain-containing protein [Polyangia bacterium]HWE27552.1 CBS domain-containing protein [Polyangia bacterium]
MKTNTVKHYMTPAPYTIGVDQPLNVASEVMRGHHVRHLPVLRGGRLAGILSQRDVALICSLPKVDPADVQVEDAMSEELYTVSPETPLEEVAATMAAHKYGAAVIVDGHERLLGVFTTVDALLALADGAPAMMRR